ncbi:permease YjgP/YjgQ family protein [gut metagenome]|uniref:Permease YjgP/YjgQ family protein n=1 Tax=gut metagenome TaxID=749906 RepID=J9FPM3_9ZZZZ
MSRLNFTATKAAGVSLLRVMRPLGIVALLMTGVSFYFQNSTSTEAQVNLRTLLFSMKQQSPAVEIPEGVFYNGVPNINLFVQKKNAETGMLYQTIIYKTDQGFEKAQIVLADSARLEMTADKLHLKLDLWNGEQFQALQSDGGANMLSNNNGEPYDRETFNYKQLLIDFDSNFNLMDKELLTGMPQAKNMKQIEHSVDSMEHELDSVGRAYYADLNRSYYRIRSLRRADSLQLAAILQGKVQRKSSSQVTKVPTVASIEANASNIEMENARQLARSTVRSMQSDLEWKTMVVSDGDYNIRRHWVEWHQKMTLSLACIIFFFVGAPLGAIIRKGGLGMPTVISVAIFIFWYIINTSSMKMARDGSINMALGMWISTLVIAPFGIFITYKANRDSVVFNLDAYRSLLFRWLGIRTKRHLVRKEVIIEDPRMDLVPGWLDALREDCRAYNQRKQLLRAPNYVQTFFRYEQDEAAKQIRDRIESLVEELSNSRDSKVLALLNEFPSIYAAAHTSPFHSHRANVLAGIFFPLGLILWFRIWRFRLRLLRDLRITVRTCDQLDQVISGRREEVNDGMATDAEQLASRRFRKRMGRVVKGAVVVLFLALLATIVWNGWKRQKHQRAKAQTEQADRPGDSASGKGNSSSDFRSPSPMLPVR